MLLARYSEIWREINKAFYYWRHKTLIELTIIAFFTISPSSYLFIPSISNSSLSISVIYWRFQCLPWQYSTLGNLFPCCKIGAEMHVGLLLIRSWRNDLGRAVEKLYKVGSDWINEETKVCNFFPRETLSRNISEFWLGKKVFLQDKYNLNSRRDSGAVFVWYWSLLEFASTQCRNSLAGLKRCCKKGWKGGGGVYIVRWAQSLADGMSILKVGIQQKT